MPWSLSISSIPPGVTKAEMLFSQDSMVGWVKHEHFTFTPHFICEDVLEVTVSAAKARANR